MSSSLAARWEKGELEYDSLLFRHDKIQEIADSFGVTYKLIDQITRRCAARMARQKSDDRGVSPMQYWQWQEKRLTKTKEVNCELVRPMFAAEEGEEAHTHEDEAIARHLDELLNLQTQVTPGVVTSRIPKIIIGGGYNSDAAEIEDEAEDGGPPNQSLAGTGCHPQSSTEPGSSTKAKEVNPVGLNDAEAGAERHMYLGSASPSLPPQKLLAPGIRLRATAPLNTTAVAYFERLNKAAEEEKKTHTVPIKPFRGSTSLQKRPTLEPDSSERPTTCVARPITSADAEFEVPNAPAFSKECQTRSSMGPSHSSTPSTLITASISNMDGKSSATKASGDAKE